MRLPYWTRILVGALFGLVALGALWPTLGITWVTALAAALAAPIGFLGSYFVVSADRPEEGYEQVLFDRPNTIISTFMILAFALAGVGTGLISAGTAPAPLPPEEHVFALRESYQSTYDAWTKEDAEKDPILARATELRNESDRIAVHDLKTLPEGDERAHLEAANDAYAFALDALLACVETQERGCKEARLKAADGEFALQKYVAMRGSSRDTGGDAPGPAGEAPEA